MIRKSLGILFLLALLLLTGALSTQSVLASFDSDETVYSPFTEGVSNDYCLSCHEDTDQRFILPSGEELYLGVNADEFHNSVHGKNGYACVQCHTNIVSYPHPETTAQTRRDLTLELNATCSNCHAWAFDTHKVGAHQLAQEYGNKEAAVCTDCHPAHNVQPLDEPRTLIPQTCERCHSTIYEDYAHSVHGSALLNEGNPDVPECVDCHGSHFIEGPSTGDFHLFSPQLCEKCHADKELMSKYGLSTDIRETYVSDFHGRSVTLFEPEYPGQESNKPVCIDCHGVHNIRSKDDPDSSVMQGNLLATCQKCHPDADSSFPTAWMGHYPPSREYYPLVYYVQLFYKIFIPTVLGGMLLFVGIDFIRRMINTRRESRHV